VSATTSSDVSTQTVKTKRQLPEVLGLVVVLLALVIFFSITSPVFFTTTNGLNMVTNIAVIGIMAVPGTFLLIAGQVDLSVASVAAMCGMVMAALAVPLGIPAAVAIGLLVGLVVGLINGFLVMIVGVNSLIVTLGGLATFFGIGQLIGDGQTILVQGFRFLGTARPFLNIPMPVILFVSVLIIGILILRFTVYGRQLYAIGANPTAARLVGIPSKRVVFIAFMFSSVAAALAGLILVSQLGAASPNNARGYELLVVTAIVLGGASLSGGRGTILGTFIGLMIIQVLATGLTLLNVQSFWQSVATGILLITAVSFDRLRERLSPTN
jgi:ribose transport system permease protein